MSNSLFIIIPAYNEELNIEKVVKNWYAVMSENLVKREHIRVSPKLVIIDDSSTDSTYNILKSLQVTMPDLVVLRKENGGHGAAILYGYLYALNNGADYVFQTDSDDQTSPEEFFDFWSLKDEYDVIIGHRKCRQDGLVRIFVTVVLKLILLIFFGVCVTDANTPFRLMKADILRKYISKVPKDYNLANVLLSVLFIKNHEKVKFLPITFRKRKNGTNFINIKRIFKIGINAVFDFYKLRKTL